MPEVSIAEDDYTSTFKGDVRLSRQFDSCNAITQPAREERSP